jgi:radical SAM protein with 4Fe4S-binding SPASM domain
MCPRSSKMTRKRGFMKMALYRKIIDEICNYSREVREKEIELFHFGESLLHPDYAEMIAYASRAGLKMVLSVNAPDLKPGLAKQILDSRPHRLVISLDGVDDKTYKQIRGKNADFSAAEQNIDALYRLVRQADYRTDISIRMIVMKMNADKLPEFQSRFRKRGFDVDLRAFFPWGERDLADLGHYEKYPPNMPCPFPWQHLVIQWDGSVVPCCRDYNGAIPLGNVNETSLKEIWDSARYRLFRQSHATGRFGDNLVCRNCTDLYCTFDEETNAGDVGGCSTEYKNAISPCAPEEVRIVPTFGAGVDPWDQPYFFPAETDGPDDGQLRNLEREILYWAARLPALSDVARCLGLPSEKLLPLIDHLSKIGLLSVRMPPPASPAPTSKSTEEDPGHRTTVSLAQLWHHAVQQNGKRPFIIDQKEGILTYRDADEIIRRIAGKLIEDGIESGDRIALWSTLQAEALLLIWGAFIAGVTIVPLDPEAPTTFIEKTLRTVEPKVFIMDEERRKIPLEFGGRKIVFDTGEQFHKEYFFSRWLNQGSPGSYTGSNSHDSDAVILFTSGTSGPPKGVVLSQAALAHSGRLVAGTYDLTPKDVLLSTGELHAVSGLRNPCVATVAAGAAAMIAGDISKSVPEKLLSLCNTAGVTVLSTTPSLLQHLLSYNRIRHLPSFSTLRLILSTADRLKHGLRQEFQRQFDVPILNYYGLTETAGICLSERQGMVMTESAIGTPVDALLRVVDDQGNDVPTGGRGELWIQNANRMSGYYKLPEESERAYCGRWYRTGDIFTRNLDGTYSFVQRRSTLLKNRYGDLMDSRLIADALAQRDGVGNVRVEEVAARDNRTEIIAFIKPAPGADTRQSPESWLRELRVYLAQQLGYKNIPDHLQIDKENRGAN